MDKRNYYDFGKKFHAEVHYLPSKYEDSTTALVLFRYSYDLISFQKFGINHPNNDAFYSVPKIEIEFEDNDGIIRSRILKQDTILEKNYEKTISKTDFLNSAETINLLNGKYKVKFRLSDQTKSNIKRVDLIDTLPNNYQLSEIIGSPIFVEVSNNESFNPYVIRNNIKFSSKTSKILIPVSFKDEFTKYFYSIKFVKGKKSGLSWSSNFNKEEFIIPRKNSSIGIKKSTMNSISLGFNTLKTKAKAI